MPPLLLDLFAFIAGSIIGSFLNVCIHRLPQGLSIVMPPSHCPSCKTPIGWTDNIPIVSYLLLRGRCRTCALPISPRYPLVEALTGLLSIAVLYRFDLTPIALLYFAFAAALVVITFIDIDHYIIPDAISLPGIGVGLTASFIFGTPPPLDSAIGIVLGGGILFVVAFSYEWLTKTEGMGFGDVKLLAMIGAFLGWRAVPLCLLVASFTGAFLGITAILFLGKDRRFPIPFGPRRPVTVPVFGVGRRNSRKPFLLYWWTRSSFRGSGSPMIRIASNGHFRVQIPQAMHVSSLIAALPVSWSIQMTSVPVRCGGQYEMHSRLQRFGWHRSLNTTAIRMEEIPMPRTPIKVSGRIVRPLRRDPHEIAGRAGSRPAIESRAVTIASYNRL